MAESLDIEYDVKMVLNDESYQDTIKEIQDEGWVPLGTVKSVTIIHVVRQKHKPQPVQPEVGGGFGTVAIDDTKVHILGPDGKLR
jgi:hypothetical protein